VGNSISQIAIVLLAILPGYLARQGSCRIIPRTQRKMGAMEEVADFLILSVLAHLAAATILLATAALLSTLLKIPFHFNVDYWLQLSLSNLITSVGQLTALQASAYMLLAMLAGWTLGVVRGLLEASNLLELIIKRIGLRYARLGRFWSLHVERFLISSRPIIYDAVFPDLDQNGSAKTVFVEVQMKANSTLLTGRVLGFSIANDEEPHKILYLGDVYKKESPLSAYNKLDADGLLLDLADALTIQVRQV